MIDFFTPVNNIGIYNLHNYSLKGYRLVQFLISTIILLIISGWCTDCYDLDNYRANYETDLSFIRLEELANPGFAQFNIFFSNLGITFETFHIIIFFIFIPIITINIFKLSKSPLIIIFIYLCTSYFGDIIQLKNTLALGILMIALKVLLNDKLRYGNVVYLLLCLLAATFHIAFIFYAVFIFAKKEINAKRIIYLSIALSFLGHSIFSILSNNALVIGSDFLSNRAESYAEGSSYISLLLCTIVYLIHFKSCKLLFNDTNYSKTYYNINVLLAVLLIFSSINMTFFRLFRNMIVINSIFMINSYHDNKYKLKNRRNVLFWIALDFISWSIFFLFMSSVKDSVSMILENNSLWKS